MFQLHTFPNFHVSGLATTSLTLYNMFGILTNHPKVQDQAFHQIQTVLGNRTPTLQDKPHLPICEAVSHENSNKNKKILEWFIYSLYYALVYP